MKKFLFFFLFFLLILFGMNYLKSRQSKDIVASIIVELPEDFVGFYNRFHTDSTYQLDHISFPLEGLPAMVDTTMDLGHFKWLKRDWVIHKTFNDHNGTYIREFDNIHNIITCRIYDTGHRFEMRTRYSKIANEWHMIYYASMNSTLIYD